MLLINFNKKTTLTIEELREVLALAEHQETADKYTSTSLHINGDNAVIDVELDEDGDITI